MSLVSSRMKGGHQSVLLKESVEALALQAGDTAIDATLGLGGHAEALCQAVGPEGTILGLDLDENAVLESQERLLRAPCRVLTRVGSFKDIAEHAREAGIEAPKGILFDLGWNATQLHSGRGFSFNADEPLLMTLSASPAPEAITARDIVNRFSEDDLREVIRTLGEERFAGRIARAIVERRAEKPFETAQELAEAIERAVPRGRTHPATKTFQALRILVNDELSSLKQGLEQALELLAPKGRVAVITFHSIEDGLVKRRFREWAKEGRAELVVKKPIVPTREEIQKNPRARSAKLRVIEKTA
jgi:16S rRNA (cytosine1402-N4)-methyltransferase